MILLNFSHPITREQRAQIRVLTGKRITRLINIPVQFDDLQPFFPQIEALMTQIPLSTEYFQTRSILVNLPSLNFIAAGVLVYLHAILGHFPSVIRLRPLSASLGKYEVAEIMHLQDLRVSQRPQRFVTQTED
jgi:hypothetical protein